MADRDISPDRVRLFSDAVFAVIITILVLKLKPPDDNTFHALLPLWPTGLSYVVSYLFIAIVWVNHHHLFGYAEVATPRLVWSNFAHLFSVSLIPHRMRTLFRMRSIITIGGFTMAALVALRWPVAGMVVICVCLIGYLRPDLPTREPVED
jgi:uncharacterized membrane protein